MAIPVTPHHHLILIEAYILLEKVNQSETANALKQGNLITASLKILDVEIISLNDESEKKTLEHSTVKKVLNAATCLNYSVAAANAVSLLSKGNVASGIFGIAIAVTGICVRNLGDTHILDHITKKNIETIAHSKTAAKVLTAVPPIFKTVFNWLNKKVINPVVSGIEKLFKPEKSLSQRVSELFHKLKYKILQISDYALSATAFLYNVAVIAISPGIFSLGQLDKITTTFSNMTSLNSSAVNHDRQALTSTHNKKTKKLKTERERLKRAFTNETDFVKQSGDRMEHFRDMIKQTLNRRQNV